MDLTVGTKYKDWKIEQEIGEGAYGKVYKISRTEFGHEYISALKVISIPKDEDEYNKIRESSKDAEEAFGIFEEMVNCIVDEFALMSALRGNTNIVSYEDHEVVRREEPFGWDIFIRMEYLTPLVDVIKNDPPSTTEIVKMGIDICTALEVCKKEAIIHRDIKPENIFVSKIGRYKLGDFGIACQAEGRHPGIPKQGTYAYMAPEICKEKPFDETADIYSLGIVLYTLLNHGRGPHLPAYPAKLTYSDRINANVLRMSGKEFGLPDDADQKLGEIVLKACEYEPQNRFSSATEFKEALEGVLEFLENEQDKTDDMIEIGSFLDGEDTIMPKPAAKTSSKKPVILIAVIIAAALVAFGILGYGRMAYATVPDLYGKTEEEALAQLEESGLELEIKGTEYDEKLDEGYIISQNIEKGVKVRKKTKVDVVVSAGKLVSPPKLEGLSREEAIKVAETEGFTCTVISSEYSDDVEKGNVIRQIPASDEKVQSGSEISVVISLGSDKVLMPSLVGKSLENAIELLDEVGLGFNSTEEYSDTVESGKVISQSIEAGKNVASGTTISIVVSKGKEVTQTAPSQSGGSSGSSQGGSGGSSSSDHSAEFTMGDDKPVDGE